MQAINTGIGQTFFDIAIQHQGDVETAMQIAINAGMAIDSSLPANTELLVGDAVNPMVVAYYQKNGIVPGTCLVADIEGIDYWIINDDFIVS